MGDPELPLEQRSKGNCAMLNYYRDLQTAAVVSRRCRLMLLGTGGVGKTTLANRLVTGAPSASPVDVTHGVLQCKFCSVLSLCTTAAAICL
jgi:hypothetical protein